MITLDAWMWAVIIGLTVISVVSRGFFLISERAWNLPGWARRGMRYAPIAALAAVVAPDIAMPGGHFVAPWGSAHAWSALAAAVYYFRGRQRDFALPLAIVVGLVAYLPLRLLWGA